MISAASPSLQESPSPGPSPRHVPLSLYVHLPWCVAKCPYCDFNSHALRGPVPESRYTQALLADLERDLEPADGRAIRTVFLGGGTPSLFSPDAVGCLLEGIRQRARLAAGAEITLEANPGTVDEARFAGFRAAGVNRLSIGVQSFDDRLLAAIGRIHDGARARLAMESARRAGFDNVNLDLMFALPGQSVEGAVRDVDTALALAPEHLSHYQLTLEPGTPFHHRPPVLPDGDAAWAMQRACGRRLRRAGFRQYEVSAWARPRRRCRHNLNYWRFGDYLGIGAGAHGKVTLADGTVRRTAKQRHPGYYLRDAGTAGAIVESRTVDGADLAFECLLNALRLSGGIGTRLFRDRTGLSVEHIEAPARRARELGLLSARPGRLAPTARGRRFLDDLVGLFL